MPKESISFSYNDVISWLETQKFLASLYIMEQYGLQVGDSVLVDGNIPATIHSATYDENGLLVTFRVPGDVAADHLGDEAYRDSDTVVFPCGEATVMKMVKQT